MKKLYLLVGYDYFETKGIALFSNRDDAVEYLNEVAKKNSTYPVCQRKYAGFNIIEMELEAVKIEEPNESGLD